MLNLGLTSEYSASLLFGNQWAPASANTSAERVLLDTAEVNSTTSDGAPLASHASPVTGSVAPASAASAAYAVLTVTLIPPELGLSAPVKSANALGANVGLKGSASDSTVLTTAWVAFPISVCNDCPQAQSLALTESVRGKQFGSSLSGAPASASRAATIRLAPPAPRIAYT